MFLFFRCLTYWEAKYIIKGERTKTLHVPDVRVFRSGRLLNDVTLLLSALRSTEGSGSVGVSEWERSCNALPPAPWCSLVLTPGTTALLHTRRCELGDGEGERAGWWCGKWANPGIGSGGWGGCRGWWGRVLLGSLSASILRTACGDAAPSKHNIKMQYFSTSLTYTLQNDILVVATNLTWTIFLTAFGSWHNYSSLHRITCLLNAINATHRTWCQQFPFCPH